MVDDAFTGVERELGITAACRLTGRSRATYRRLRRRHRQGPARAGSALGSGGEERAAVLELMNCDEYAELPPARSGPASWMPGATTAPSPRCTGSCARRAERRARTGHPPAKTVPELVACALTVFTWDIAAGPAKGIWYHAYVIIDIFSRYIVGHVEAAESAERARS
ncbi:hypothetical protein ACFQ0G_52790 [Streptomyces chiangmaiensis]